MPSLETDRYNWNIREQEDPFNWPSPGPQDGGGGATGGAGDGRQIGDSTKEYISTIIKPISDYISSVMDVWKKSQKEQEELGQFGKDLLKDPLSFQSTLAKTFSDTLTPLTKTLLSAAQRGKESGPISDFMKSTDRGLASIRIPKSKPASQRPINKLQKRENTKGFYK